MQSRKNRLWKSNNSLCILFIQYLEFTETKEVKALLFLMLDLPTGHKEEQLFKKKVFL